MIVKILLYGIVNKILFYIILYNNMDTVKRVAFERILGNQNTVEDILKVCRQHKRYTEVYKDVVCKRILEVSGYVVLGHTHHPCAIYSELTRLLKYTKDTVYSTLPMTTGNKSFIAMSEALLYVCNSRPISNEMLIFLMYNGYKINKINNITLNMVNDMINTDVESNDNLSISETVSNGSNFSDLSDI